MKKSFKRILFLAITAAVVGSLGILSAAAADPEPSADAPYAAGTVELRKNITVTDSAYTPQGDYSFYLYSPTDPHDFDMMSGQLNAVIYVYPDKPFASEAEALARLTELGLVEIAEKTPAYIVCPNPLNGTAYTEDDLNVYYESSFYLAGGKIVSFTPPAGEYARCTYHNMQYIMAEGQGADFVHNVLSQNANRIAGILTFGGEMDAGIAKGVALPAYLVNADQNIIDYYKAVNGTDAAKADDHFVNSGYTEKQVIVKQGGDAFTKETITDAWNSLLSHLTRAPLESNVVINTMDMTEWVLMTWPSYDEIGVTVKEHTYNYDGKDYLVYDYVPASYTGEKAVPLVIVLHGFSEDPLCPAATCGWAEKASEEGFIVVAPDYINDLSYDGSATQPILQVIAETQAAYHIDASRIYMTGFSMGGMNTITTGFANPDIFAAIAPMAGGNTVPDSYFASGAEYDLPVYWMRGTIDDTEAADEAGNIRYAGSFVENFAAYNGVALSEKVDYSLNPFGYEPTRRLLLSCRITPITSTTSIPTSIQIP